MRTVLLTALIALAIAPTQSALAKGSPTPPQLKAARISDTDYPKEALKAGLEGDVLASFIVDLKGRVTECKYQTAEGAELLGDQSCSLLVERFRYTPARDAERKVVAAEMQQPFYWRIGGKCPANLAPNAICITRP